MNVHTSYFHAVPQSVPLRYRVAMRPQTIEMWTPVSVLGALARALQGLPRRPVPAAIRVAKTHRG